MTAYRPEVQTAGGGDKWDSNSLLFATREEAERYVDDLMFRWTAVTKTRVVEVDGEPNRRWDAETQRAGPI